MELDYSQRLSNPNFYNITQIHKIIQTRPKNRNGKALPIYLSSNYNDIFLLFDMLSLDNDNDINFFIPPIVMMKQEIAQDDNEYGLICRYDVKLYEGQYYTFYEKQFTNLQTTYVILSCDSHRRFEDINFNVLHYIVNDGEIKEISKDVHLYIGVSKDIFMTFWQQCHVAQQNDSIKYDVVYPLQDEVRFGGFPIINIIQHINSPSPILKVSSKNMKGIIMETAQNFALTPLQPTQPQPQSAQVSAEPKQPKQPKPTQPSQSAQPLQSRVSNEPQPQSAQVSEDLLRSRYPTESDSDIEPFHKKP